MSKVKDSIESSGGSPQLLELLEAEGKDFKYDTNLPHIAKKVQQLYLAHFKNGGFSNKIAGYKATLISDDGYHVMRTSTGEVVDVDSFLEDPEYYSDVTSSKLKIHRNIDGKIEYAEVAMTRKQAEYLGLRVGDVTTDLLEMIGTRIPTQTHHSMMPFKVVEFLPEYMGDSIIAPSEVTYYSGADYDIDKLFILRKDFYVRNGVEQIVYGGQRYDDKGNKRETTIEEKWEEFQAYEIANNKELTKLVKNKRLNSEEYQKLIYKMLMRLLTTKM